MARDDVELVQRAFPQFVVGEAVEMGRFFADEDILSNLERIVSPDAVIEFATPAGGSVGDMAGPFRGTDGMRAGWAAARRRARLAPDPERRISIHYGSKSDFRRRETDGRSGDDRQGA